MYHTSQDNSGPDTDRRVCVEGDACCVSACVSLKLDYKVTLWVFIFQTANILVINNL